MVRVARPPPRGLANVLDAAHVEASCCRLCPRMAPHEKPNASAPAATGYAIVGTTAGAVAQNPLLLRALRRAGGISLDEHFFVTSALRCLPPRPPGDAEARRCRPFLQLEMRLLRPRVVLCFGAVAARALLDRDVRITEEHGRSHVVGDSLVWTLVEPGARNGAALRRCGLTLRGYERWLGDLFASLLAQSSAEGGSGTAPEASGG